MEIEECFRLLKSDFRARLVYLSRDEAFGFRTDYEIVTAKQMKKIFKDTKK